MKSPRKNSNKRTWGSFMSGKFSFFSGFVSVGGSVR